MKQISNKDYEAYQQYQTDKLHGRIIDRYEYCGHTVSCKSVSASYKSKKHIRIPKDEWLIFNPENGEFMDNPGGQGYESGSSWSRGQSWALYGFVLSYILSGKAEYLDAAKRVANYFISQCCDDWLPRCDFRQPEEERILDNAAGNIAACGLIELARQLPEREGKRYFDAALCILKAQEADAANWAEDDPAIFTKCTVAYHSPEGRHITMTYADYFFIEAVNKLRGEELLFWNP
jgi:Glycosyl Hydrolase Family 88.